MISAIRHVRVADREYVLTAEMRGIDIMIYIGDVIQAGSLTQSDIDWVASVKELHGRICAYAARIVRHIEAPIEKKILIDTAGIDVTIFTTMGNDHVVVGLKVDLGADLLTDAITDELIDALGNFDGWHDLSWVVRVEEGEEA